MHGPGGRPGEPPVGEQQRAVAEPGALDRRGDGEHLPHPRPAGRPLVPDDDRVAGRDPPAGDRVPSRPSRRRRPARCPRRPSDSNDALFTTAPSGASDPRRIVSPPVRWIGSDSARMILPSGSGGAIASSSSAIVRPETVSASPCSTPGVQQRPQHDRDAADPVDVGHHVPAERLDVGQVRGAVADPVEVVQGQLDPGLVRDREQVQHRVGGAADRHHDGDRVLEGLLGEDLAGGDAGVELARARPRPLRTASPSRRRSTAGGEADPISAMPSASAAAAIVFAVYMPRAGALGRAGVPLDLVQLRRG